MKALPQSSISQLLQSDLADSRRGVDLANTDRGVRAKRRSEMYAIARPSGDQPFGIGNRRLSVLNHVALDIAPITITEGGVVGSSQIDGEDAVLTEDIGTESSQTSLTLVVRGLRDQVRLQEFHARGGQFDDFGQIDRDQVFHLHLTLRRVLQDIDGGVVRVVGEDVAESERMNVIVFRLN